MRIGLIGGIYGMPPDFRGRNLQTTTETQLETGLAALGHEVVTDRHRLWNDLASLDLVHIHHLATSCVQLPLRRIPVVFTRHATKPLSVQHSMVLRTAYQRADALVALSEREREEFVPARHRGKTTVIYNGIDPLLFHPPAVSELPRGPRVQLLYVGQLIELKRVHLALDLLSEARGRGVDATLSVVTHRPTLLPELQRHAADLQLTAHVTWGAARGQAEVAAAMREADVLVLPSRTEALSTVISEAVFSGLPPLTFHVGGAKEQLPEDWPLPAPEDVGQWLEHGMNMIAQVANYRQKILQFRDVALDRFSVAAMVRNHVGLYEKVI